ncbi:MAG: hypothetical protein Q8N16_01615 [bacterium]|nr:hypothetical protein [bacterium]
MANFFGHQKQWLLLKKSESLGKLSHAYLFSGKSQLGKKEIAFELARLANCKAENSGGRPCGKCLCCQETEKNCHPDFLYLEAKPSDEESGINSVRDLTKWLSFKPGLGGFKVAVIDQFQKFSLAAQSALLKTLEEPRGDALLILISDYPEFLLPTIASRLQEIRFYPLSEKEIVGLLTAKGASQALAKKISFFSFGRPLKALDLLAKEKLAAEEEKLESFGNLLARDLAPWFKKIGEIAGDGGNVTEALEAWLNPLRLVLLARMGVVREEAMTEAGKKFFQKASHIPLAKIRNFIDSLDKANYLLLRTNANARLVMENSVLELF